MKLMLALLTSIAMSTVHAMDAPPASVGVSPTRIELDVDGSTASDSATVLNMTDKEVHLSASVVSWDLDEENAFRELPTSAGTLPAAMIVNPVDFSIPPHGSQTIRFAVMPERLDGLGEHRAMLFVSEMVDTSEPGMRIRFRLGVPIYARVGPKVVTTDMHGLTVRQDGSDLLLDIDISSNGTIQTRPSGHYLWWPKESFPGERAALRSVNRLQKDPQREHADASGGVLATKPVFAGYRRTVAAQLQPPELPGEYVLALRLDVGDQVIERTVDFEVAPPPIEIAQNTQ